ncbi:PEP-CTERM sorting domain-containing protein [Mariniblastus sp.]|nr:PEP-CTERM sorting domain-containing protein [Mariniblastus sp.]
MRLSKKFLLPLSAVLLFNSLLISAANAEMVTFSLTGRTQATIDNVFFNDVAFAVTSTIDDNSFDQMPFQDGRGAFAGAVTTLSIPSAGIVDALSTNVTGILQEDFGTSRFRLVDPSNFFGQAAVGVGFNVPGVIPDPNLISPFVDPTPTPTNFEGGLTWQLLLGPNVTFNSVTQVTASSSFTTVGVPEPTSFTMFSMGLLAVSLKRRRR